MAWLPVLQSVQGTNFWDYIQAFASYVTPPPVAIFMIGILWKRATEQVCLMQCFIAMKILLRKVQFETISIEKSILIDERFTFL